MYGSITVSLTHALIPKPSSLILSLSRRDLHVCGFVLLLHGRWLPLLPLPSDAAYGGGKWDGFGDRVQAALGVQWEDRERDSTQPRAWAAGMTLGDTAGPFS